MSSNPWLFQMDKHVNSHCVALNRRTTQRGYRPVIREFGLHQRQQIFLSLMLVIPLDHRRAVY